MKISGIQNYAYATNFGKINFTSKRKQWGEERVVVISPQESKLNISNPRKRTTEELRLNKGRTNWRTPESQKVNRAEFLENLHEIGKEKGTPLTSKEIAAILNSTQGLNKKGINNVLIFVKHLKERPYQRCDAEYVREHFTYDKYHKKFAGTMPEGEIQARYKERLNSEIRAVEALEESNRLTDKAPQMDKYFNADNWEFIEFGIASSSDPRGLAELVLRAGMNTDSISKLEPLMDMYRMSHRNIAPVLDLERCFYPVDIENIVQMLRTRPSNDLENYKSVTYCNYYGNYVPKDINVYDAQKIILKKLNLLGKIKPLRNTIECNDIMDRGRRLGGSYGQGKKH